MYVDHVPLKRRSPAYHASPTLVILHVAEVVPLSWHWLTSVLLATLTSELVNAKVDGPCVIVVGVPVALLLPSRCITGDGDGESGWGGGGPGVTLAGGGPDEEVDGGQEGTV